MANHTASSSVSSGGGLGPHGISLFIKHLYNLAISSGPVFSSLHREERSNTRRATFKKNKKERGLNC
jgi:hypothetical protein